MMYVSQPRLLMVLFCLGVCIASAAQANTGYIQVQCEPGVQIFLNGELQGVTSSDVGGLIIQNVRAGSHTLRAVKPGFMPQEGAVSVAPGQVLIHSVRSFVPQITVEETGEETEAAIELEIGTIVIQSLPVQCKVSISAIGFSQDKTRDVLTLSNIPAGNHTLAFEAMGKTLRQAINLKANARIEVMVNFVEDTVDVIVHEIKRAGDERTFAGIEMVWIPPGTFTMGSPSGEKDRRDYEGPQRQVTLSRGFWLGKYPVTQAQWQAVMGNNPSQFKGDGRLPVETVFWNDAQEFIQKLNGEEGTSFRLPTEAEWEYACRAGTTTRFYWGNDPNETQIKDYAWYGGNSGSKTHPVGQKRPNAWGLYDMSGNVWEWCEDDWHGNYNGAPTDGRAWVDSPRGSSRVYRGGGWGLTAGSCRSANRAGLTPEARDYSLGFRLALPAVR